MKTITTKDVTFFVVNGQYGYMTEASAIGLNPADMPKEIAINFGETNEEGKELIIVMSLSKVKHFKDGGIDSWVYAHPQNEHILEIFND